MATGGGRISVTSKLTSRRATTVDDSSSGDDVVIVSSVSNNGGTKRAIPIAKAQNEYSDYLLARRLQREEESAKAALAKASLTSLGHSEANITVDLTSPEATTVRGAQADITSAATASRGSRQSKSPTKSLRSRTSAAAAATAGAAAASSSRRVKSRSVVNTAELENDFELARQLQEQLDQEYAREVEQQQHQQRQQLRRIRVPSTEASDDDNSHISFADLERLAQPQRRDDYYPIFMHRRGGAAPSSLHHHSLTNLSAYRQNPLYGQGATARVTVNPSNYNRTIMRLMNNTNDDFTPEDYEMLLRLDEHGAKKKCLSKQEFDTLPSFEYKGGAAFAESGENECSICFDEFHARDKLTALVCTHKFHTKCIREWLTKEKRECPICKKDALSTK